MNLFSDSFSDEDEEDEEEDKDDYNDDGKVEDEDMDGDEEIEEEAEQLIFIPNQDYLGGTDGETQGESEQTALRTLIGVGFITLACLVFTVMNAIAQKAELNIIQLISGQCVVQLVLSTVCWNMTIPPAMYEFLGLSESTNSTLNKKWYGDPPHRCIVWVRGTFMFLVEFSLFLALKRAPIGDVLVIHYINPLLIVLGARLFFGEPLPSVFPITFALPIIALILIVQPEFIFSDSADAQQLDLIGAAAAFVSGVAWAAVMLLERSIKGDGHYLQAQFSFSIQSILIWIPLLAVYNECEHLFYDSSDFTLIGDYQWDSLSILLMIAVGMLNFFGYQYAILAYQYGQASKIGYFEYLDLNFAFLTQVFIFGDETNAYSIIGFCLMTSVFFVHLAEELYLHWKERKEQKEEDQRLHETN